MDDIKAECIFNEQVHVKEEEDHIKEEPEWEEHAGLHGISAAAARAGLYANHEVKDELVLGPVGSQPPDIAFTLYACPESAARAQPVLGHGVARLERSAGLSADARRPERQVADNADVGNQLHSNANITMEKETYVCDICNKRFALKTQLMEHVMIHMHQELEQEKIRVASNAARAPTARQHPALRDCVVRLERLEAGRAEGLARRDTDIEKEIHGNINISTEEETYICDTCKKWFPVKSQLVDHVMIHIQRQESRRGVAGNVIPASLSEAITTCAQPNKHIPKPEDNSANIKKTPIKNQCEICKKTFTRPSSLKTHKIIHTGEKPYECNICKKEFTVLSNMRLHKRIHRGYKPYVCDICQKAFSGISNMKIHRLIHEDKKPHSCPICKKKFRLLGNLRMHELIHSGVKKYACEICKKKFKATSDLKRHAFTHTNLKPYTCQTCNKKFKQPNYLKLHERTHTGIKPFSCVHCDKKFTQSGYLKIHERSHTGLKPHTCEICEKKFTQRAHLNEHKKTHIRSVT